LAPIFIQIQRTILVTVGVMALVIIGAIIIGGRLTRPIVNLMVAAERIAAGSLDTRAKAESHDEIGQLALAFNGMAEQLQVSFTTLERTNEELQAANSQLQQEMLEREVMEQERAQLQQEVITAQQQAIRELSTPIIPLMEQIIILPLIGTIDSTRARDLTRSLLAGISHHRARVVILDLTGVPAIDGSIAGHLDKTLQAARLKGAQTILTGISEEVAETLTELGIAAAWQPSGVRTVSNLQAGLALALKQLRG
jgi:rsbT co-antagonist protein RsbR